jgi:adenosine deaminase
MDYRQLPKIELHLHLDCSLSYEVVRKIDPTVTPAVYETDFIAPSRCTSLVDYIRISARGYLLMQTAEQLKLVTLDVLRQLDEDGVTYAEIRFAPLLHTQQGLSPAQVVEIVQEALEEGAQTYKVIARLLLCTLRHYSEAESMATVQLVEQYHSQGWVVGFDIAGDEAGYPVTAHQKAFDYAHEKKICCTAHAGEACGAASVWEVLQHFRPTRIGHGVRSVEDPQLLHHLKEQSIHLEVCPSSNLRTNIYPAYKQHVIHQLYTAGVSLSVNTDARTVTPITLSGEYENMARTFGWTLADFLACNLEALQHAFVAEPIKEKIRAQLIAAYR